VATILIVDDQPDNLYVLDRLLRGNGYQVLQADRGQTALDLAQREQPDLILLDVMMPEMDGFEVVQRLRQDATTQAIPVVLLTANAPDQRLKIQGLNLGADEYLTQPINNSELLARLRALLRAKQVQDELVATNRQLRAVLDVIQAGTSTLDLDKVGQHLVDGALRAANLDAGGIWLMRDDRLELLTETGFPDAGAERRQAIDCILHDALGQAVYGHEVIQGKPTDLYGSDHAYGALKTLVMLPLIQRDQVVGLLQLAAMHEVQFSPNEVAFLSALANAATASVQNARLFAETDHHRQQLQAIDNEKDEFISVISHELKNPLASIKGYAGLLARRARKDPGLESAVKAVDVIQQQVNRMTMLLDQLRDVSHIGINRFSIEVHTVDLIHLVEHAVRDLQTTTADHTIQVDVLGAPLLAAVDEFRIEQVVNNLVGNAIKYSPDGGVVEVVVGERARFGELPGAPYVPTDWAVVTVRDHGIGIPQSERERLFERFFRAANARGRVSGMGLGLYIAREIIQRHGGRMWVDSVENQGSLFGIAVPLVSVSDGAAQNGSQVTSLDEATTHAGE
jgi:signal transduction histidine kinase